MDYNQYLKGCKANEEITRAYNECGGPDIENTTYGQLVDDELQTQSAEHPFLGIERSGGYITIKRGGFFAETFAIAS